MHMEDSAVSTRVWPSALAGFVSLEISFAESESSKVVPVCQHGFW